MKILNVMIKPSSSKCNLACDYCFYMDLCKNRQVSDYGFMSEETSYLIVDRIIEYLGSSGRASIGFQGGEPTLIGLDFYKKMISYIKSKETGIEFTFTIQTNGSLLDQSWLNFFKENNFLVGISLDGLEKTHDYHRKNTLGEKTFKDVLKSIYKLEENYIDFNILTVVNKNLLAYVEEIYTFYKDMDFKNLQFIPCLNPLDNNDSKFNRYSPSSLEYGVFLDKLFKLWYKDFTQGRFISIRYFDNILNYFLGLDYEACDMQGICSIQNIIEADGQVYPCDFYVLEKEAIGDLKKDSFLEIFRSKKSKNFLRRSFSLEDEACKSCIYFALCRGGCMRHRNNPLNKNQFCQGYKYFFEKNINKFQEMALIINKFFNY